MDLTINIHGKDYDIIDDLVIDGKMYIAYEDENGIYVNAYTTDNDKINLLEITEEEKNRVIKELSL